MIPGMEIVKILLQIAKQINEQGETALFVLKITEDFNEEFNVRRVYHVSNDPVKAWVHLLMLNQVTEGRAIIEVWCNGHNAPSAAIRGSTGDECETCEYSAECDARGNEGQLHKCRKMAEYSGFKLEDTETQTLSDKSVNKIMGMQKAVEKKPNGLKPDTSISDILLDAYNAMNECADKDKK